MIRLISASLILLVTQTACVTSGSIDSKGFSHKELGYNLPYKNPQDKQFLEKSWKIEMDSQGQVKTAVTGAFNVTVKSINDMEKVLRVNKQDMVFKHQETNGVISIQSFPLREELVHKKMAILAKDFAESLAGQYLSTFALNSGRAVVGKNLVTDIVSTKSSMIGTAETYEAVLEVADGEQIKLNPKHRLLKYKLVLIRPKAENGWKMMSETRKRGSSTKWDEAELTFPAMIALLYAMDFPYYQDYVADFDSFVARLQLRN